MNRSEFYLLKTLYKNTVGILRFVTVLLFLEGSICAAHPTYSQTTLISLDLSDKTIKEVFKEIENNSEYIFFYYDNVLDVNRKVHLHVKDQTVHEILDRLFKGTTTTYFIKDRQIFISKKNPVEPAEKTIPSPSVSQERHLVTGKVLDETGEPLPGAAVMVQGSTRGVTTDLDGSFEIEVTPKDKLVISFLGMKEQTIAVAKQQTIIVKLQQKADELQEVTVVGYGKQKKASVIGAISSIQVADIKQPVGKISTSLAGQMAGIVAVQRSGEPATSAEFWIRGINTFGANNTPLVLVDGIERPLNLVDAQDIETFSILKDATATAIYGVRGANGVLLITTRKGKEGKPVINASVEYGFLSPTRMPEMADAMQFIDMYNDVYRDQYGHPYFTPEMRQKYLSGEDPDLYPNVNWMKEIYKNTTTSQRANVNVTGGGKNIRYYVAGSIYNENGVFNAVSGDEYNPSLKWTKYNFRSNIDINLHRTTVLSLYLSNQFDVKNQPNSSSSDPWGGDLWQVTFKTVAIATPKVYSDGKLACPVGATNPYNLLNNTGYTQVFNNNAQSLVSLEQDFSELITEGLKANVKFSWDAVNSSSVNRYKDPTTWEAAGRNENGDLIYNSTPSHTGRNEYLKVSNGSWGNRTIYLEASLTYERLFAQKHRVGGLFLFNMREQNTNQPADYISAIPHRNQGIAGRATYSFMDRYFLEGNFGYNGSENFAPGRRFGFFPSIAAGYLISNEKFWTSLSSVLSSLKFKGSYGKVGNDEIGGGRRFAFNTEMQNSSSFVFGQGGENNIGGIATGYPGNPNVSWEEATKLNVGVELELFRTLKLNIDYFHEKRNGIFIERESVPSAVGVNVNPYVNLGRMKNEGIDASMEYNRTIGKVSVSARGNFTFNRNLKLYDDKPTPVWAYRSYAGRPYLQDFGLIALGYFESEQDIAESPVHSFGNVRPGDIKYKDINGDGVVNSNDQVPIGRTPVPEINYGFGVSAGWNGFDVSVFFQGIGNVTNLIGGPTIWGFYEANFLLNNVYSDVADNRWTVENPDPAAKYPRMDLHENVNNKQMSTAKLRDMSFIRLKNAEIGYTFPRELTRKIGFSTIRVYAQGVNLFTFSKFKLWDPEISSDEGSQYPNMRIMNVGLNLNF
ncbi:TonB-dependent receptor [Parabacteroides pacaensis]|uniref:TonB-dependent receptor n=1 Tax=Parabacteroides pacaensis TaxID=2086575 RepID=UPI000D0E5708|nr:TonB-dependent receptor [Parabacteroides pacaensis]